MKKFTHREAKGSPEGRFAGIPFISEVLHHDHDRQTHTVTYDCGCVFTTHMVGDSYEFHARTTPVHCATHTAAAR